MFRASVTDTLDMDGLLRDLDQATRDSLASSMERVAATAQGEHAYKTQTGTLEGSTAAIPVTGSFIAGSIETGVEAGAEYASYVAAKTGDDFLQKALDSNLPDIESRLTDALDRVISRP